VKVCCRCCGGGQRVVLSEVQVLCCAAVGSEVKWGIAENRLPEKLVISLQLSVFSCVMLRWR
jgi:hypothetical protein